MSDGWNLTLLGATDAVGKALLDVMEECQFPFGELFLFSNERSAREKIRVNGQSPQVSNTAQLDWSQTQLAFFVSGTPTSALYAAEVGCLVVDINSLFALEPDVPLVVPRVNNDLLANYRNPNMVVVADTLINQLLLAVKPRTDFGGQSPHLLNGLGAEPSFFPHQLTFNLLPLLPDNLGSMRRERSLVDKVRKFLGDAKLAISVCNVQSPMFFGHAQLVHRETLWPMAVEEARVSLADGEGLTLRDKLDYAPPVGNAWGDVALKINCLRNDYGMPDLLQFWSMADNVRFGTALMAILSADKLIAQTSAW